MNETNQTTETNFAQLNAEQVPTLQPAVVTVGLTLTPEDIAEIAGNGPTGPITTPDSAEPINETPPTSVTVDTHEQAAEINATRTAEQGYVKVGDMVPQ
jgi:hypothetical protein